MLTCLPRKAFRLSPLRRRSLSHLSQPCEGLPTAVLIIQRASIIPQLLSYKKFTISAHACQHLSRHFPAKEGTFREFCSILCIIFAKHCAHLTVVQEQGAQGAEQRLPASIRPQKLYFQSLHNVSARPQSSFLFYRFHTAFK